MVTVREALAAAVGHHRDGRLDEARPLYHSILKAVPGQPDALHLLGVLEGQRGRVGLALALLRRALAVTPTDGDTLNDLALTLRGAGDARGAALAFRRALLLDPTLAEAAYNLGNLLLATGDPAGAAERYRQALSLRRDFASAWNNLGSALLTLDRAEEAASACAEAVALQPADAETRVNRANALTALGSHAAAARARRQALALAPALPDALYNLAVRLLGEAGMDRPVVAGRPLDQRKLALGLRWLLRTLEAHPDHQAAGEALLGAALKLLQAGLADDVLVERAARIALRLLRRDRRETRAAAMVAYHLYRKGRTDLAGRWMQRFACRFTPAERVEDFELRGWSLVRADRGMLDRLPDVAALLPAFAPLELVAEPPGSGPVVAVACDDAYFRRFAGGLLDSVERHGGAAVHVHVVNPSPETEAALSAWSARLPLGFSRERTDLTGWDEHRRKTYYACIRFVRWHQLLQRWGRPLVHVDADCTLAADPTGLAAEMDGYDLGLLRDRRGRGPTRDVTVCFAWFQPTERGALMLSRTAAYIAALLQAGEGYWMLDQAAPFCVLDGLRRRGQGPAVRWFDWMDFPWAHFIGEK